MRVETIRFGEIEVGEEALFHFPMGILGFARHKRFFVLDHGDTPFKWLQSVDDGSVAFIITDPLFFRRDYHIAVRRADLRAIEPNRVEDLIVSVIMTVPDNPQDMSANLLAPLIFNLENRQAMQLVLTDHRYPVKYFVLKDSPPLEPEPELAQSDDGEPRSISLR